MSLVNNSYFNSTTSTNLLSTGNNSSLLTQSVEDKTEQAEKKSVRLEGSDIVVSSRAQKLRALSQEFFANQDFSSANIAGLTERAYEYGLISESQYKQLQSSEAKKEVSTGQSSDKTSQSLAKELESLSEVLAKRNNEVPLEERQDVKPITDVLMEAAKIMQDPESAITKEQFEKDIERSIFNLNVIMDSDSFENLPLSERKTVTDAASALNVIEKLAPRNVTNNKVNQYLANSL